MAQVLNANLRGWGGDVLDVSPQENDYIESYFDNGENFAADSDDNMDGEATYWDSANWSKHHGWSWTIILFILFVVTLTLKDSLSFEDQCK